jgi:ribosomal protein S18 acetylase RimI-like enzyme
VTLQLLPFPAADYAAWRTAQVERRRRWQFGPLWSDEAAAAARARTAVEDLAPADGLSGTHLHRLLDDDGDAGWLWISRQGGDLLVLDAEIESPAEHRTDLLALLEGRARAWDARQLVLDRMTAAPTTTAIAQADGFTVVSQTMVLDLARHGTAGTDRVALVPMTASSYDAYLDAAIDEYAREILRADGVSWSEALDRSRADYDELLPQGLATPGQVLFDVVDTTTRTEVGALWLELRPPAAAFVYDVFLSPAMRGQGLGRAAMVAGAHWCRNSGVDVLGLSVFGRNAVARGLYESLGYTVVTEALRRPVEPAPPVAGPR